MIASFREHSLKGGQNAGENSPGELHEAAHQPVRVDGVVELVRGDHGAWAGSMMIPFSMTLISRERRVSYP